MKQIILFIVFTNILFANVIALTSGEAQSGNVAEGAMSYYKISATDGNTVKTIMNSLTKDGDLYVKTGSKPTTSSYDCRSIRSDTEAEECSVTLSTNSDVFIGIHGYEATNYQVKATVQAGNGNNIITLTSGTALTSSVSNGETKYYKITVTQGQSITSLLNGLNADADLYVKLGEKATSSNFDCKSTNGDTNNDSCTLLSNENTDVYISVYGFKATNYKITAILNGGGNENNVTTLTSGTKVSNLVVQGEMKYYKISVQHNKTLISLLNGLSADSDLYVRLGEKPTINIFDCKSDKGGITNESCTLPSISENTDIYIGVYGFRTSTYSITATLNDGGIGKPLVIYEDAEDQSISRWTITDNNSAGATVTNIYDADKNSRVIKVNSSDSYGPKYQIGTTWNNRENFNIIWDMKTSNDWIVDIAVTTREGVRYIRYIDNVLSYREKDEELLVHGLGIFSTNGAWHQYRRDLLKDLKDFEPNNDIISVDSFSIQANASIDNIELFSSPNKVYENAEDSQKSRWSIYAGANNAQITNVYDLSRESRVISLQGNNSENKYLIGNEVGENNAWEDTKHSNLKWSFKSDSNFKIYLFVNTLNGTRKIKYSDTDINIKGIQNNEIYFGIGENSSDGKWHTFIRDIAADVKYFDNGNELVSIDGLLVVGNSRIDDLELFTIFKPQNHKAGFSLTFDDLFIDGWYSMRDTFLKYDVKSTFFLSYFDSLSAEEITKLKTLESDGHEIACHTLNHKGVGKDYNYDSSRINTYISEEIIPALNNMKDAGFNPVSFAYPYGERNKAYDNAIRTYFPYIRDTFSDANRPLSLLDEIFNKKGEHYNILSSDGIDHLYPNNIKEIRNAFIKARENGEIISLFTHQIDGNLQDALSPQKLKNVIMTAQELGLKFYTYEETYTIGQ